ncbi:MAG: hypothetical protein RMY64_27480 [Nostoc sp. DedQUE08]|uniref:hypothetical protein n=1 Tax=Nostoc sp. DedQUE08 TaxID=3075393 RepID=UPI002AD2211F|nr:hypothetical protein [Nostoc sp. DedQUE08]MDZ8069311.1 hypothetical protein [Nostoc sp. DedQUE08]
MITTATKGRHSPLARHSMLSCKAFLVTCRSVTYLIAQKSNNRTVSQVNTTAELGILLFGALITINLSSNFTYQIEPTQ